jgi:hypothetical protein
LGKKCDSSPRRRTVERTISSCGILVAFRQGHAGRESTNTNSSVARKKSKYVYRTRRRTCAASYWNFFKDVALLFIEAIQYNNQPRLLLYNIHGSNKRNNCWMILRKSIMVLDSFYRCYLLWQGVRPTVPRNDDTHRSPAKAHPKQYKSLETSCLVDKNRHHSDKYLNRQQQQDHLDDQVGMLPFAWVRLCVAYMPLWLPLIRLSWLPLLPNSASFVGVAYSKSRLGTMWRALLCLRRLFKTD